MEVLEHLLERGFSFRSFPAYPRHLGVVKDNCVALLELTPEGKWKQFSSAGYLLEDQIALLVERDGQPAFVYKAKQAPATEELLEKFRLFQQELESALEEQ